MSKKAPMFNGQQPKELRKTLGIPKDFHVTHFLGVPLEQVPRAYLVVMVEGAIYEARALRKNVEDAIAYGDELKKKDKKKKTPEATPVMDKLP